MFNTYFTKDEQTYINKGIIVFNFDETKSAKFINDCIIPFRDAYISSEVLSREVDNGISTKEDALKHRLPTKPSLKSGEFGEILVFYLFREFYTNDANVLPLKWRWKENQDTPSHLTDVIILKCEDIDNPKQTDYIYSVEVKSGATPIEPNSSSCLLNNAIEGALKDKSSRIAKTIIYLKNKYVVDGDTDNARKVMRFDDKVLTPYKLTINAAIVIEKSMLQYHINGLSDDNLSRASKDKIGLFVVPLARLKQLYEEIYNNIPTKG